MLASKVFRRLAQMFDVLIDSPVVGDVLTWDGTAWVNGTGGGVSINEQTGTDYTLLAGDNGKIIICDNAADFALTVPADLGETFTCTVIQGGEGQVSFVEDGATINSYGSLTSIGGQHGRASLIATAADTFNLSGSLSS